MFYLTEPFKREYTAKFNDCAPCGEMRISSIMRVFSELAELHYAKTGMPREKLLEGNMVFLLSRVALRVFDPPRYGQPVEYATKERGCKGPFFYRQYEVSSGEKLLAVGNSAWIICDSKTHRILRPKTLTADISDYTPDEHFPDPVKIALPKQAGKVGERTVYFSDLDGNGHVNNTRYSDIAVDFLPGDLQGRMPKEFLINFVLEAKLGDRLELFSQTDKNSAVLFGQTGGKTSFECSFKY